MGYRVKHRTAETASQSSQAILERWLSETSLSAEVAVRNYRRELSGSQPASQHADIFVDRLLNCLVGARAQWDIHQRYVIAAGAGNEVEDVYKTEAAHNLSLLPVGSSLQVAALSGRELCAEYADGNNDVLSWPLQPHGKGQVPATRPTNMAEFIISKQRPSLTFSKFNEPILADDTTSVKLTFSETNASSGGRLETPDFVLFLQLPEIFERMLAAQ